MTLQELIDSLIELQDGTNDDAPVRITDGMFFVKPGSIEAVEIRGEPRIVITAEETGP